MMNKKKNKILLLDILFLVLLVSVDQYTKYIAVQKLKNQPAFNIINGVLEFNYLENRGAAFGMLQNQKFFFVFVAIIFLCVIAYVIVKVPLQKKYNRIHILLVMIATVAIYFVFKQKPVKDDHTISYIRWE